MVRCQDDTRHKLILIIAVIMLVLSIRAAFATDNQPPMILSVNLTSNDAGLNRTNATLTVSYGCDNLDYDFLQVVNESSDNFTCSGTWLSGTCENTDDSNWGTFITNDASSIVRVYYNQTVPFTNITVASNATIKMQTNNYITPANVPRKIYAWNYSNSSWELIGQDNIIVTHNYSVTLTSHDYINNTLRYYVELNGSRLFETSVTWSILYKYDVNQTCDAYSEYRWYNDSGLIAGQTASTLSGEYFHHFDNITAEVLVEDNSSASNNQSLLNSTTMFIWNTPPVITLNSFVNTTPAWVNGTYKWNISYYDEDGDAAEYVQLYFRRDGTGVVPILTLSKYAVANGTSYWQNFTIDATNQSNLGITKRDRIFLKDIFAYDGTDSSDYLNSNYINLTNAPPYFFTSDRFIPPVTVVYTTSTLALQYIVSDIDDITYTEHFEWSNDTGIIAGETTNSLTSVHFTKYHNITGKMTFTDPDGANLTYQANWTIANIAPTLASIAVEPSTPYTSNNLTCANGSMADADNDTSFNLNYRWYANNNLKAGLTTKVIASTNTAVGEVWFCEINISDGEDSRYYNSSTVTIAGDSGGGGGTPAPGGGGGGFIDTTVPENSTFLTVPSGVADILARKGTDTTFKIIVLSKSSTGVSVKLSVIDNCGIYKGYTTSSEVVGEYLTIPAFGQAEYYLDLTIPQDYDTEQCSLYATFIAKDGNSQSTEIRVWNNFWTNLLSGIIKVTTYSIRFDTDASKISFLTPEYFLIFPSAASFTIPMFGLVFLIFSFVMVRFILYRYITELRSKSNRLMLFSLSIIITTGIGLLLAVPLDLSIPSTSSIFGGIFLVVVIMLAAVTFRLPKLQ